MTYQQTLDFMFSSLPMYHRIGQAAYKADLANTIALMDHLGHPEQQLRCIHVAGTNGKGSVSHLTATLLQLMGYKVGLYTSPHLVDFRERIRINGEMIPTSEVTLFVEQHRQFLESQQLSFFEMTVGLAFSYFVAQKVDIAVIEVGLGGRLDSTNVVTPILSVITNIGFDHTQFLGDTLAKIASEKAGIIKDNIPVVIGETHGETSPVFNSFADQHNAPIVYADQHYKLHDAGSTADRLLFNITNLADNNIVGEALECPLAGSYQYKNIATFFQVATTLFSMPFFCDRLSSIDSTPFNLVRQALRQVVALTGLHGRWEVLQHNPLVVCETAHNADGIHSMLDKLRTLRYNKLYIIYGCVNDKDYASILRMLPQDAEYYYTQPSVPRRLPVAQLATTAAEIGKPGPQYNNVHAAIKALLAKATSQDMILITGSIFLIADALTKE